MSNIPLPNDVRRQASRAVNQDGLVDIFMGFTMLVAGGYIHFAKAYGFSFNGLGAILPMLVIFGIRGLRRRYTYPRVGYANLKTRQAATIIMIVMLALVVLGLGLFLLTVLTPFSIPRSSIRYFPLLVGFFAAGWSAGMGWWTGFARYYAYAAITAAALAATYSLGLRTSLAFSIPMAIGGGIMFITGLVTFIRFIRAVPRQDFEVDDGA